MDHIEENNEQITVKSYGLPYIFWGYLLAVLIVIVFMIIAIKGPLSKLIATGDDINVAMAYTVWATLFLVPMGFTTLFFIENRITKKADELTLSTYVFKIRLKTKTYTLRKENPLEVDRFEGTPNIAKLENIPDMKTHQNKGYFELFAYTSRGEKVLVDRHSRKVDLEKLIQLLSSK